jgi:Tol biopolymer transport system component
VFSSDRGGDADVHVMNADGSDQVNVSKKPDFDNAPEWSPDGKKIVYARRETKDGTTFEIYVMNADGSNSVRLTNNKFTDIYPVFSPDGKRIVFQSDRDGYRNLYIMNADGSGEKRLIND